MKKLKKSLKTEKKGANIPKLGLLDPLSTVFALFRIRLVDVGLLLDFAFAVVAPGAAVNGFVP